MQNVTEQYLSIGEASEYLGVSIDTLRRWTKKGKLIAHRSPGKHRYFKKTELDQVFGTRYEREEKKNQTLDVSNLPFDETKSQKLISNSEMPIANVEEPSIHNIEDMDYVQAPVEKVPVPEGKQPLSVPRYIKHQNVSKYDLLLAPNFAGEIEDKIPEKPKEVVIDNFDFHPILIPSTHRPPTPKEPEKAEVVEVEPKVKPAIQEVLIKEDKKDFTKLEKILKKSFFVFLALDAILFFFWFLTYRVNSPLP